MKSASIAARKHPESISIYRRREQNPDRDTRGRGRKARSFVPGNWEMEGKFGYPKQESAANETHLIRNPTTSPLLH